MEAEQYSEEEEILAEARRRLKVRRVFTAQLGQTQESSQPQSDTPPKTESTLDGNPPIQK